jgi:hypothetical protein
VTPKLGSKQLRMRRLPALVSRRAWAYLILSGDFTPYGDPPCAPEVELGDVKSLEILAVGKSDRVRVAAGALNSVLGLASESSGTYGCCQFLHSTKSSRKLRPCQNGRARRDFETTQASAVVSRPVPCIRVLVGRLQRRSGPTP